ncbi:glycosyl transferase [Bacillus pseudomycoides]|nr:glycosyl transferase [Bacillus pseudomycoides]
MVPKVSIIVPVYNCEEYLSNCIESILNQTYKNIEIVIVNDGSIDQSEKIINEYKVKEDRIMYYYQDNCGPSEARNKGILNSTGEYVTFIDADDTVDKYYVELLLNKMINSNSDLVCCGYKDISEYGVLNYTDFNFNTNISLYSFVDMVCKGTGGVLWGKMYKKEIIINRDLKLDKDIFMCEDLVFVLQYASQCQSFSSIKEPLYHYNRCNQNSISSNISIDYIQNYITVCERIDKILSAIHLDKQKVNKIITKRIQDLVLILVEKQCIEIRVFGMKNAIANLTGILSMPYIKTYIGEFSTNSIFLKPYIFFIKNRLIRMSIMYGIYLNLLRNIKRRIKIRKQVRT